MWQYLEQDLGIAIVRFFTGAPNPIKTLLYPLHFLGGEYGYMLLLPVIFWCLSKRAGTRLLILVIGAAMFAALLKLWGGRPRPFEIAPELIVPFVSEKGNGLPSGHTIFATVIAVWTSSTYRKRWIIVLSVAFALIMGISRMIHGLHYPQDILLGWATGLLIAFSYMKVLPLIESRLPGSAAVTKMAAILLPLLIVFALTIVSLGEFDEKKSILQAAGVVAGGLVGLVFETLLIGFHHGGSTVKRLTRAAVGLTATMAVYFLLTTIFHALVGRETSIPVLVLYMFRYGLLGMWVTLGAPWLFVKTGLAEATVKAADPSRATTSV